MKKIIVIYHASASAMEQMQDASQEDMKKGMEQWHSSRGIPILGGPPVARSKFTNPCRCQNKPVFLNEQLGN